MGCVPVPVPPSNADYPLAAAAIAPVAAAVNIARIAAAATLYAAQFAAAKLQADTTKQIEEDARIWIKNCRLQNREWAMGQQQNNAFGQYANYIGVLSKTFGQYLNEADAIRATLAPALDGSDDVMNKLFTTTLRTERLTFFATLRTEEVTGADTDKANRRTAVSTVNQANTDLARAKEDGIILAFKLESQRIEGEESKRGYVGGDGFRDKMLLVARLLEQDNIATNNKGTDLENTDRAQKLESELSIRDFDLGQGNRAGRFSIYEDDVNRRITGVGTAGAKILQNDAVKIDGREMPANNALNRRFDKRIFNKTDAPPNSVDRPDIESPAGVAALAAGNLLGGTIESANLGS